MKDVRNMFKSGESARILSKRARSQRQNSYVFCDKKTGTARFTVDPDQNGSLPLDRIAGSLAVYCIAHYCSPKDLVLVVCADEALNENISARAASLLETARVGTSAVALSPREREVLRAVTENLANKEIASQLSISVRTVKFHVSALLAKFGVNTRSQLSNFSSARVFGQSNSTVNAKNESDARANGSMNSANAANSNRSASSANKKVSYFPNRSAAAFG
nr:LuxR C-terminal-related transcriptional regulator [Candidatus Acidoferrales bacterium]